jgi:ATP-binding protein involved in chromosome partitioning
VSFRTYHQVAGEDRSRLGEQVGAQRARVTERLRTVRHVVAVISGKGGVGKSFVTSTLALGAAAAGYRVGVLDADLKAPTVPSMLGASGPLKVDDEGVHPATGRDGVRVVSTDFLLADGAPLAWRSEVGDAAVWRGLLEAGTLREFMSDVVWGELDLLLVDMPPDSDRLDDLVDLAPSLAGAVAVTIPSEESRRAVRRAIRRALDSGVRLLGIVENMSGRACLECGAVQPLFPGDAGASLADEFRVPLLRRIQFGAADHAGDASALANALRETLA